jgi:Fe-S cluster assembly protein SufD
MYAFSNAIIESIKIPELKQRITKIIANKLGVKIGFDFNNIEDFNNLTLSAF